MTRALVVEGVEQARRRFLQDALLEALPAYWERRAREFQAVDSFLPLPLDAGFECVAAASEMAQTALACRRHAFLLRREQELPAHMADEVTAVLAEVA